jgi:LemA protein
MILLIIGIIILVLGVFVYYFNRFNVLENRIDNSFSQIDVQLKRRADLIPNLIESVKGYMKHEKSIIQEVTKARQSLISSKTIQDKLKADKDLEKVLGKVFALAENYPNLKANENFLELQRELTSTEDKVAYARQFFNDSILSYNQLCKTFPGNLFAGIFNKKTKDYFQAEESERKGIKVKFD